MAKTSQESSPELRLKNALVFHTVADSCLGVLLANILGFGVYFIVHTMTGFVYALLLGVFAMVSTIAVNAVVSSLVYSLEKIRDDGKFVFIARRTGLNNFVGSSVRTDVTGTGNVSDNGIGHSGDQTM